jgi:hypothetical protein
MIAACKACGLRVIDHIDAYHFIGGAAYPMAHCSACGSTRSYHHDSTELVSWKGQPFVRRVELVATDQASAGYSGWLEWATLDGALDALVGPDDGDRFTDGLAYVGPEAVLMRNGVELARVHGREDHAYWVLAPIEALA